MSIVLPVENVLIVPVLLEICVPVQQWRLLYKCCTGGAAHSFFVNVLFFLIHLMFIWLKRILQFLKFKLFYKQKKYDFMTFEIENFIRKKVTLLFYFFLNPRNKCAKKCTNYSRQIIYNISNFGFNLASFSLNRVKMSLKPN